ncbi:hypothetical protein J0A78_12920 [Providencia rettgeri]|uniref:hypothetical protein n=1 Tax=Providencia rettgeri TaxID=587 RepID=UPI0019D469C3|nr:hypothetical protein [Providencia rettgeri]MBN7843629.1 hypothetical protein [Providencia rettgeri]MBN7855317.1 hypothetical protein [Providencia rettgeri]MBN7863279.1 hypothetical protein [Providencia rettgeri]MBN7872551.1 hypothetical protein [Providencia rettgeri]MBN7897552.1 hypothetical protein [Providencia rettgeri]
MSNAQHEATKRFSKSNLKQPSTASISAIDGITVEKISAVANITSLSGILDLRRSSAVLST